MRRAALRIPLTTGSLPVGRVDSAKARFRRTDTRGLGVQQISIFNPRATPKASTPTPKLLVEAGTERLSVGRGMGRAGGRAFSLIE